VSARSHRDQYQEISQASEAALVGLNTTFDEYKRSTEAQIARHEVRYLPLAFFISIQVMMALVRGPSHARKTRADQQRIGRNPCTT